MAILILLVAASIGVISSTVVSAWRNESLFDTAQERYDREFDRIARRLRESS